MTQTQLEFATPAWDDPPRRNPARDIAAKDGDVPRLATPPWRSTWFCRDKPVEAS